MFNRQPIGTKPGVGPGPNEFLAETWFIALLGSMIAVMCLLIGAMVLVRRRQLLTKKSTLPGTTSHSTNLSSFLICQHI